MDNERFANVEIFRPDITSEIRMREKAEAHLRSKFSEGQYPNSQEINAILQHQFQFYSTILEQMLPHLASRDFMDFILFQYDQSALIQELYQARKLSTKEDTRWSELGPVFRRAIKFLAESVTMLHPDEIPSPPSKSLMSMMNDVWICAEEMVDLYIISEQTYAIFPDDTVLTIFPKGQLKLIDLTLRKDCFLGEDVRRDTKYRNQFIDEKDVSYLSDIQKHNTHLEESLNRQLGVSYQEVIGFFVNLIENSQPLTDPDNFPVLFLLESDI